MRQTHPSLDGIRKCNRYICLREMVWSKLEIEHRYSVHATVTQPDWCWYRRFDFNWVPPWVGIFSVAKTSTLSIEHSFVRRKWMLLPVPTPQNTQWIFQMLTLQKKIPMALCKTAVTPVLTHWSCCSLALSRRICPMKYVHGLFCFILLWLAYGLVIFFVTCLRATALTLNQWSNPEWYR